MRLYGARSISTPARVVLDVLLVIAGLQITALAVIVAILLVNPLHPIREHFQVTTIVAVPARAWSPEGLVRVDPGIATVRVDPWAYLTLPARQPVVRRRDGSRELLLVGLRCADAAAAETRVRQSLGRHTVSAGQHPAHPRGRAGPSSAWRRSNWS